MIKLIDPLKFLAYGIGGSGKSHLLLSALDIPELNPLLVLDFEGRLNAFSDKFVSINIPDLRTHIPVPNKATHIRLRKWSDFDVLYKTLCNDVAKNKYKTTILDSMTAIDRMCQNGIAKNTMADPFNVKPITQPEFNVLTTHMTWLVDALLSLGLNILTTAQVIEKENQDTATSMEVEGLWPLVGGRVNRQYLTAMMDFVGFCKMSSSGWEINFTNSTSRYAKFSASDSTKILGVTFKSSEKKFNLKTILTETGILIPEGVN